MEKAKSIAQMINQVDDSFLTQAEKYNAIARAERAEALMEVITWAVAATKQVFVKAKELLVAGTHQGHQA